jgi:hypothetical protein
MRRNIGPSAVEEEAQFRKTSMSRGILFMDLEETEARNDCTGADRQQLKGTEAAG